ncbi:hypothetical protein, partial [Thiolapillus sp.]
MEIFARQQVISFLSPCRREHMLYKSETVGTARGAFSPKVLALSIFGAVIALGNTVTAGQAGDGEEDFFPNSEVSDNA